MEYDTKPNPASPPHKYCAQKAYDAPPEVTAVPITSQLAPQTPLATPYTMDVDPSPPATLKSLFFGTLTLIPFHLLNFVLATVAFCMEITCVSLAAGLLPLCLLGIPIYIGTLHLTRALTIADITLANMITPVHALVRMDVSDDDNDVYNTSSLRIAPKLTRVSVRSTLVVLYFATVKFVLGIFSIVVVSLPLQPIISQIVASSTNNDDYIIGWEVHAFNFETHPVAYAFTCVGFFVVGFVLIHVVAIASRETTRYVCCTAPRRTATTAGGV